MYTQEQQKEIQSVKKLLSLLLFANQRIPDYSLNFLNLFNFNQVVESMITFLNMNMNTDGFITSDCIHNIVDVKKLNLPNVFLLSEYLPRILAFIFPGLSI